MSPQNVSRFSPLTISTGPSGYKNSSSCWFIQQCPDQPLYFRMCTPTTYLQYSTQNYYFKIEVGVPSLLSQLSIWLSISAQVSISRWWVWGLHWASHWTWRILKKNFFNKNIKWNKVFWIFTFLWTLSLLFQLLSLHSLGLSFNFPSTFKQLPYVIDHSQTMSFEYISSDTTNTTLIYFRRQQVQLPSPWPCSIVEAGNMEKLEFSALKPRGEHLTRVRPVSH